MGTGNSDPAGAAAAGMAAQRRSFLALVDRIIGRKARAGKPTGAELIRQSREQRLKHLRGR